MSNLSLGSGLSTGGTGAGGGNAGNPGVPDNIFGVGSADINVVPLGTTPAADRVTAEGTRDTYFGSNPGNLASYDANPLVGIYLYFLDGGNTVTVFQTRVSSVWVDQVSTIGIQGAPGDDAPSQWFLNETDRNDFYDANLSLLMTGLIVGVNNENGTYTVFEWTGGTSPVSQDTTLWRSRGEAVSPDSVELGLDGSKIGSGSNVINFTSANGDEYYLLVSTIPGATGPSDPINWVLGNEINPDYGDVQDTQLADPQTFNLNSIASSTGLYIKAIDIIPYQTGVLRAQGWLNAVDGPVLFDFETTIVGGDIGNFTRLTIPGGKLLLPGQTTIITLSGVGLDGGIQTVGPYTGLSVPRFRGFLHSANQSQIFTSEHQELILPEFGSYGTEQGYAIQDIFDADISRYGQNAITFSDDATITTAGRVEFDSTNGDNDDIIRLINSQPVNDIPVSIRVRNDGDPEGSILAPEGTLYFDVDVLGETAALYFKRTGDLFNTGWKNLSKATEGPVTSVLNSLAAFADTTGDTLNSVNAITAQSDATNAFLDFTNPLVSGRSALRYFDQGSVLKSQLQYLQSTDTMQLDFDAATLEFNGDSNAVSVRFTGSDIGYEFNSTSTTKNLAIDFSALPHNLPLLNLITGGLNGADIQVFVGSENPNGIVTAPPGAIYKRRDGINSTIYVHADTITSNANWVNLIAAGAGDLNGPGAAVVDNSMAVFSDITGFNVASVDQIRATRIATTTRLEILSEVAGQSRLAFTPTTGGSASFISYTEASELFQIANTAGSTVLSTALAASDIIMEAGSAGSVIVENPGANTNAPLQLSVSGSGGATVNIYSSLVNPNGVITADQGDFCFVATGVDNTSAIWIKEVGTGNTGWQNILSTSTNNIEGPATSTINAISTFDVADGSSLQDNPFLRYISDGTTSSRLILQRAAAGSGDIELLNNAGTAIGLIQTVGADFLIENVGTGDVSITSADADVRIASLDQEVNIRGNTGVLIEDHFLINGNTSDISAVLGIPSTSNLAEYTIENAADTEVARLYHDESALNASGLNLNSNLSLLSNSAVTQISLISDNSSNRSDVRFIDSGSFAQLFVESDEGATTNRFTSVNYDMLIESGGGLTLETAGSEFTRIFQLNGGNTVQTLQLDSGGASGATVNIYTSTVSPEGIITANQGDWCFVATGVNNTSAVFIKEAGTGNTGWQSLLSGTAGIAGPATSTITGIPTFNVADGTSVQNNPLFKYVSDGATSSRLIVQRAAAGSADIELQNNAGTIVGLAQIVGSAFELANVGSGNMSIVSGSADVLISALGGGITMTAGGDTLRVQTTGAHDAIFEASGTGNVEINAGTGSITLLNNHAEYTLDNVAVATVTATGVNFDVTTTSADMNLISGANTTIRSDFDMVLRTLSSGSTVTIEGSTADTFPVAQFANVGTGGSSFLWYVGDSSPQGRVATSAALFYEGALPGSGDSKLHFHTDGASITDWHTCVGVSSGASQAAGSMMYFPDANLAIAEISTRIFYDESTLNTEFEIDAGLGGSSAIRLKNSSSVERLNILYNEASGDANITTLGATDLAISSSGNVGINATTTLNVTSVGNMVLDSTSGNTTINADVDLTLFSEFDMDISCGDLLTSNFFTRCDMICGQDGDLPIVNFSNGNTQFNLFAYFQTPVGNVTGSAGNVLVRNDGANSNVYVNKNSTSNNTDWRALDAPAILHWGDASIASTTATRYLTPGYDSGTAPTLTVQYRIPRDGVLQNLYIHCRAAGGNGNNVVYTVRINSINTALAVTLASNVISGSNTTNRVNVVQGDIIGIQVTKAASIGSSPDDIMASLELV